MKKIIIIILVLLGLNNCSKDPKDKIIGTWTNFDPYNGIKEITFSENNMMIREYRLGGYPDIEIIREYKIIDNIILIEDYDHREYYYDSPYYEYSINDDKLFLYGYFTHMYSKNILKNMSKIRNNLVGEWELKIDDRIIDFVFFDNNVSIVEYNENKKIISNDTTTFEIDNYYLKINNLENIIENVFIYRNTFIYFMDKDILCIIITGAGELEPKMFFLRKK